MTTYSGQGRERLVTAAAATADANGAITFRQGPCPLGFVWQGSVTVTNAPSGALFSSSVASTPWGQHAGSTNFGPVQLWGNETLVVTGNGLQKNTQYTMLFFGVAMPEEMAEPLPPVAPLSTVAVETSTLLVSAGSAIGATNVTLRPPSLTRRLTVVVASGTISNTLLALVGTTSGANYGSGTFNSVDGPDVFYFAIEPTVDAAYTLSFSGTVSATYWVTANTTSPLVETDAAHPLVIAQPVLVDINSPTRVVPGSPVNIAGSPVGSVGLISASAFGVGNNQAVIAAPAAGQSIYVQTVTMSAGLAAGAASFADLKAGSGGPRFALLGIGGNPSVQCTVTFPGCFRVPSEAGVFVDVFTNNMTMVVTYTVGPTV